MKWVGGTAAFLLVLMPLLLWWAEGRLALDMVLFVVGFSGLFVIAWSLWYRLGGVAEVRVSPEAVVVRGHGGAERRIERAALVEAWQDKRWVLRTRDEKVVIRDEGFTTDDWLALSSLLYAWKMAGDTPALPGVAAPERRDGPKAVVFEVHRPTLPVIAGGAFAIALLGVGVLVSPSYRDGSWAQDPMISVMVPLAGLFFSAIVLRMLPTLVRRAVFLPEAVRFEQVIGMDHTVPYREITDALGEHVDTPVGTFYLGRRNSEVFERLLEERLEDEQLTGRRWVEYALTSRRWVFVGTMAGLILVPLGAYLLGAALGLEDGWRELLAFTAFAMFGLLHWIGITLWARHLLRNADD